MCHLSQTKLIPTQNWSNPKTLDSAQNYNATKLTSNKYTSFIYEQALFVNGENINNIAVG